MKSRYDNSPGKDAKMQNVRQRRFESEHSAKNAFVKRQQNELSRYAGKPPKMREELMEFNANMANTGMEAERFGKSLTSGIDHVAYPVNPQSENDD